MLRPTTGACSRCHGQAGIPDRGLGEGNTPGLNLDLLGQKIDRGQVSLYFSFLICEMGVKTECTLAITMNIKSDNA